MFDICVLYVCNSFNCQHNCKCAHICMYCFLICAVSPQRLLDAIFVVTHAHFTYISVGNDTLNVQSPRKEAVLQSGSYSFQFVVRIYKFIEVSSVSL
jgi:hypothetical protein